jgi:hypothetical protein
MTLLHLCTVWQGILLESVETTARGEFEQPEEGGEDPPQGGAIS